MKSKRKRIYLTNDFHNTSTFILCKVVLDDKTLPILHSKTLRVLYEASSKQIREAWKRLCGIAGCDCSNRAGMRGRNNPYVDFYLDGSARFWEDKQ